MKKIKGWFFSIFCWVMAAIIIIIVTVGSFLWTNDDEFIYMLLIINCMSPVLMLITIGAANQPDKEK